MIRFARSLLACAACWLVWTSAPAAGRAQSAAPRDPRDAAIARLEQDVRDLRQMLIQAMQIEQQHFDLVLKLIRTGTPGDPGLVPSTPPASGAPPAPAIDPTARGPRTATVSGKVRVSGAGAEAGLPVFVFIEDLKGPPARGQTLEIVQKGKQFSPQVAVVPVGTRALFPNDDPLFHNVFSLSPGNVFDLGLKAGDRGKPVLLGRPGRVEVYCDIHARMWAEVLVVRNGFIAQVSSDGRFSLPDVPTGERVVAAWTAGGPPVRRAVRLTGSGAHVDLAIQVVPRPAHNNKLGQPYGNYTE